MGFQVKKLIGGFHGSVERFFLNRRKEATPLLAIGLFGFCIILLSLLPFVLPMNLGATPNYSGNIAVLLFVLLFFFGIVVGGVWIMSSYFLKSKAKWQYTMYCWSWSFLFFVIFTYSFFFSLAYFSSLQVISYFLLVLCVYANITALKVAHQIKYWQGLVLFASQPILLFGALNLLAYGIQIYLYHSYYPSVSAPEEIATSFNVYTENSSLTIAYSSEIASCLIKLPQKWDVMIDDIKYSVGESPMPVVSNINLKWYYIVWALTAESGHRVDFIIPYPPQSGGSIANLIEYKEFREATRNESNDTIDINLRELKSGATILDIKDIEGRHDVNMLFEDNITLKVRYSPNSNTFAEDDFNYIINNIYCHASNK